MEIRTDFPGGNGIAFEPAAEGRLRFEADRRGGLYSMWFHFAVERPNCDVLRCELLRARHALGWPYSPRVRPVFRRVGGEWERAPASVVDADAGTVLFDVACRKTTTEVAFCYPYQHEDWQVFCREHLARFGLRRVDLGRSELGNPLFAVEVGSGPLGIWLTSRSHSGETPGSFTLEGILAEFADVQDPRLTVRAIPFLDLDGVVSGMYGKERPPVDFNRAWGTDPTRPEIRTYKEYLASLDRPPVVAADCHAPTATDPHCIEYSAFTGATSQWVNRLGGLVRQIARKCEQQPETALDPDKTRPHPGWYPDGFERSQAGFLQSTYGTLAVTLESAYHATHRGTVASPTVWRTLGRSIARGILGFLDEDGSVT